MALKNTQDLIDTFVKTSDHVYVPSGKVTWRLPTEIPSLDRVLGGGFPGGSIVQIYGPEKAGKTTLAYHIAGKAIKQGLSTLLIPIEKYSDDYAEACGIDLDQRGNLFHIVAADFAELTFNLCIEAVRNYDTKVIVMDSISAATPKADLAKPQKTADMEKGFNMASQARSIGDFIRKIQQPIRRKEALFITVNQLSTNIGAWHSSLKPKGGMQLQYFSDVKLKMWGKDDKVNKLIESTVTVDKGKDWDMIPYGTTILYIYHARGVDTDRDIIDMCVKGGIIEKKGTWFMYGNDKCQGVATLVDKLRADSTLRAELLAKANTANVDIMREEDADEGNNDTE